jgi:pimeloyl-ACP methyl ester carboxylesterase
MITTTIDGALGRVAIHQSTGMGPTVVMIHGNSSSSRAFERQIDGPLGEKYRLIGIDLPGHGHSPDASDPDVYTIIGFAVVLSDLVRRLCITDSVFVGWSLGGHILLQATSALSKARGFMIIGTPPLASPPNFDAAFLPSPVRAIAFSAEMNEDRARQMVQGLFKPGTTNIPPSLVDEIMRTDSRVRAQLAVPSKRRDQVEIVAKLKQPLAVVQGAADPLINGEYYETISMPTLWRGTVQTIANAGHVPHWEQPAEFDAVLGDFIEDCSRTAWLTREEPTR